MKILIVLILMVVVFDCTMGKKAKGGCKGSKKALCAELTEKTEQSKNCEAKISELESTVETLQQEKDELKQEIEKLKSPPVTEAPAAVQTEAPTAVQTEAPKGLSCNVCSWVEDPESCESSACLAEHTLCMTMNMDGIYVKGCRSAEGVKKDKAMCDPDPKCELTTCSESNCN